MACDARYLRVARQPHGAYRVPNPDGLGDIHRRVESRLVQSWQEGSEFVYNPNQVERWLLPSEYIFKTVDYWNTDIKLSKTFSLGVSRSVRISLDVKNLWNTKRLNVGGTAYTEYVIDRRTRGGETDLRYGDESTWVSSRSHIRTCRETGTLL